MSLGAGPQLCMSAMRAGLPSYAVLTPSVSARVGTQAPGTQSHKLTISACKLWDAVDGTVAPLTATASGIFDVWLVYNSTNIWGNVQRPGAPSEMNWNMTDARCGHVVSDIICGTVAGGRSSLYHLEDSCGAFQLSLVGAPL